MNKQIAVYCQGTFGIPNPTDAEQQSMSAAATALTQAGYTTVIIGQWHAKYDDAGLFNIYYNNTPYSPEAFGWTLQNITAQLHEGGVRYVTMTFGPFTSDFDNIRENLDAFKVIVGQILIDYKLNGLDFDPEPFGATTPYTGENQELLANLADWVAGIKITSLLPQPLIVTASPFEQPTWWAGILQKTTNFTCFNVQSISSMIVGGYPLWQTQLGLPADSSFIVCGFNVSDAESSTPEEITTYLQGV